MGGDHLWEEVGAIGQVLGSIAVFITLVYLAVQTRQTERQLQRAVTRSRTETVIQLSLHQFSNERFTRAASTVERGLLIRVDPTAIVVGDGGVELDLSSQTSLQLDTAPTNTTTGFGASPIAPTAANMVSLYQADATAIRCKRTVSWLKARPCVAYVSGINYTTA